MNAAERQLAARILEAVRTAGPLTARQLAAAVGEENHKTLARVVTSLLAAGHLREGSRACLSTAGKRSNERVLRATAPGEVSSP